MVDPLPSVLIRPTVLRGLTRRHEKRDLALGSVFIILQKAFIKV
jgi:hypothetical protein